MASICTCLTELVELMFDTNGSYRKILVNFSASIPLIHTITNMGRARAGWCDQIDCFLSFRYQRAIRDAKRPPLVWIFENKSLIVCKTLANDSLGAMRICRPVRYRNWIRVMGLTIVLGGSMLCDDIVRYHSSCFANIKPPREMVIILELVKAIPKARPFITNLGLLMN